MLTTALLLISLTIPSTGEDVIREMFERYDGRWYDSFVFVQETSYFDFQTGGLDSVRTWYESMSPPGMLRIDVAPLSSGNGMVFRNDTLHIIRDGSTAQSIPLTHPLLVMGFDVYFQAPEVTIEKMGRVGVDVNKMFETTWQGRDVYVIGAENADERTNQVWIDKERLVFVRSLTFNNPAVVSDTRFDDYERLGDAWVAPTVRFFANDRLVMLERYSHMRVDVELPPSIYGPDGERQAISWVVD